MHLSELSATYLKTLKDFYNFENFIDFEGNHRDMEKKVNFPRVDFGRLFFRNKQHIKLS